MSHPASGFETPPRIWPAAVCRVHSAIDSLHNWLTRYRYTFIVCATMAYFAGTCYLAHRRLFWFDEIFTLYISRLPNIASIWSACTHGVDFNPPLLYLMVRWSQALFGTTELGLRMPQIVGFWIFCLCLYRFVSVRTGTVAGLIVLLFPLATDGYWYAYDARSHGVVLGFFGLALICWQAAASRSDRRLLWLCGLAASLTGAVLCHCYAFLLFIPLGLGELFRTILRRRCDIAVWCAIVLPISASLLIIPPMLRGVRRLVDLYSLTPPLSRLVSGWELVSTGGCALAFLLVILADSLLLQSSSGVSTTVLPEKKPGTFAWHEGVAAVAMLATPVFAYISARMAHAPFYGRYSLVAIGGFACLLGAMSARSRLTGLLLLSITAVLILAKFAVAYRHTFIREPSSGLPVPTTPAGRSFGFDSLPSRAPGNDPILLADILEFAPIFYYAPPSLRSRLVYLNLDANADGYLRLQECCGAPGAILTRQRFLADHSTFYVYARMDGIRTPQDIGVPDGSRMALLGCFSDHCLFHVEPAGGSAFAPGAPSETH